MTEGKAYNELREKYDWFSRHHMDAENFMAYIYHGIAKSGDTVIDVGANHALHTLPLAKIVGKKGKVYAFEAIPHLAVQIKDKTADLSVNVINAAVTNHNIAANQQEISFIHVPEVDGLSGIHMRPDVPSHAKPVTITVPTTTLDASIPTGEKVSFIKIDAEGGDFDVIRGAERVLRESKPVIVFEFSGLFSTNMYDFTKDDFFKFFESVDYHLFTFTGEKYIPEFWNGGVVYWEVWAVHKDSPHLSFFENNLSKMALQYVWGQKSITDEYIKEHKALLEKIHKSRSYRFTAPLRKLADYYRKFKQSYRS